MTANSNSYATALFMLASEEGCLDEFSHSLSVVCAAFDENPEYLQFLSTPTIPKNERTAAIAAAFDGKVHEHILSFIQLICEHGKLCEFDECVKEFEKLCEWSRKCVTATVTSALPLDDNQKDRLVKALQKRTGKSVLLQTTVDPSVLGGLVVEIDGQRLDGSIKHNLKQVKEVITG